MLAHFSVEEEGLAPHIMRSSIILSWHTLSIQNLGNGFADSGKGEVENREGPKDS